MDQQLFDRVVGTGEAARRIAIRHNPGSAPGVLWLGGFKSDMAGTKAEALVDWAAANGRAITRFDYSGHGESGGAFEDGTLSRWLEETRAVFDEFCRQPTIVVGSSMGGWVALLLQAHLESVPAGASQVAGLVLIAPAPDFTEELMWANFPPEVRQSIMQTGRYEEPSDYSDEPYLITRQLIEDGRHHLILGSPIETLCPVHILQGVADPDVPWTHAQRLFSLLSQDDAVMTLIKDGDHRLSRPQDIERLLAAVAHIA